MVNIRVHPWKRITPTPSPPSIIKKSPSWAIFSLVLPTRSNPLLRASHLVQQV